MGAPTPSVSSMQICFCSWFPSWVIQITQMLTTWGWWSMKLKWWNSEIVIHRQTNQVGPTHPTGLVLEMLLYQSQVQNREVAWLNFAHTRLASQQSRNLRHHSFLDYTCKDNYTCHEYGKQVCNQNFVKTSIHRFANQHLIKMAQVWGLTRKICNLWKGKDVRHGASENWCLRRSRRDLGFTNR